MFRILFILHLSLLLETESWLFYFGLVFVKIQVIDIIIPFDLAQLSDGIRDIGVTLIWSVLMLSFSLVSDWINSFVVWNISRWMLLATVLYLVDELL